MAQDETAVRAASAGWSKAAQSKDLEKSLTFFADDAIMISPQSPAVEGKDNIRKGWQQMLALPGPGLSFSAARVEVARSGDLAWEQGAYEFGTSDKKGQDNNRERHIRDSLEKTAGRRMESGRRYSQHERIEQK